jgi:hypothetical protein
LEKRYRIGGEKPTEGGETERRKRENQEKKKRNIIKLSPNLLRFIRYGSCTSFLLFL